jgi:NADPH2:quinone reductase
MQSMRRNVVSATYRAMMITKPGGPEVLQPVDLPLVEPGPGELRVRLRACGVGATDLMMLKGGYAFAPKLPLVGGYEISGVVEALGGGVSGFHVGQRVAALSVYGGFAEYLVRDARHFVGIPDEVSDVQAASVILNYVTAWQMIHRVAKVQAGQTALVTGAGGGVGSALLQLLRLAGVKAYGSASPGKHGLVAKLGAIPIDYQAGPVNDLVRTHEPTGVDVAFDAIGGANIRHCIRAVRKGGTAVGYGFMAVDSTLAKMRMFWDIFVGARLRGRRGSFYGISLWYRKDPKPFHEDLPKIFALLARRKIAPVISATMPLADARQALELLATGTVEGKIVLVCAGASALASASTLAKDAAKQLGGVLHADLLHDVGPVTLDGARA